MQYSSIQYQLGRLQLFIQKGILLCVIILGSTYFSYSQVISPKITCLSVAVNGNVTINWIPSTNVAGSFVKYTIYSNSSGTFNAVTTLPTIGSSLFIHGGAGAQSAAISYFITASYFDGTNTIESPALDTIRTIFLNLNNPNDGTAILQWNDPVTPLNSGGSFGNYYYIHQEYPIGNWSVIDSVLLSAPNYKRDTISICHAHLNYRVELKNALGCSHYSNIPGDEFSDQIAPAPPVIQSVSVDTLTGNTVISWNPSTSEDAIGYIVVINISGGWVILDTVYGYLNTSYTYTGTNASLISEPYGLAAFDSCYNGNPAAPNTSPMGISHRTIYAKNTYNVCAKKVALKWNKYINWNTGVAQYEIYRKTSSGNYTLIGTNPSTDTIFEDVNLLYNQSYCYVIKAISNSGLHSFSNKTCRFSNQPPIPNYSYLSNVSVVGNTIDISLFSHTGGITKQVILERSEDNGLTYNTIETRNSLQSTMVFSDVNVAVNANLYKYRISLKDSCNNISRITNTAKNIVLTVTTDAENFKNQLNWNPYENWQLGVSNYEIYRSVNGIYESLPIATVSAAQGYYIDDVANFIGTDANGLFCYKIEAVEITNTFGSSSSSFSNEACGVMNPLVFIPNAIVIGGINQTWKPVINLVDFSSYNLRVYTRFGEVIFETSDPEAYWDGSHKSQTVPLGVYVYQVTFNAGNGKYEDYRGTITVVR